jgi:hypothetical protein
MQRALSARQRPASRRRWRWVTPLAGLVGALIAVPSSACINSVVDERLSRAVAAQRAIQSEEDLVAHLLLGEEHLRLGNHGAAATALELVESRLAFAGTRIRARFLRTHALLSVRTEGRWPQAVTRRANGPRYRARALATALTTLRERAREQPNDPRRQSELGEALAAIPALHAEAIRVLDGLAREDLLTSAHAYAALAKLRLAAHDEAGARAAIETCRKLDAKGKACTVAASGV